MTMANNQIRDTVTQPVSMRLRVGGQVQGVGYRPFVYRLAMGLGLAGWVRNEGAEVTILITGQAQAVETFIDKLIHAAPQIAKPILLESKVDQTHLQSGFEIKASAQNNQHAVHLPVDYFICPDCLAELNDPNNRRYHYPFINCTQCGPRYTLIKALPYDRPNTTMATFAMCPACEAEYRDPSNRRFHAEPIACPACGPQLSYEHAGESISDTREALRVCVTALRAGQIIAIKGIGGYHLCCDALNPVAIQTLRARKQRPAKPLAVMFAEQGRDGLDMLRHYLHISAAQQQAILSSARPIVLLQKMAHGLPDIGAMLPYSPLHHLLLEQFARPLVTTSANFSGEPVLTDNNEVSTRLKPITTSFLHHDRPIYRPADDSLVRCIANKARPLRLGRGLAPLELKLPVKIAQPVLACGGHMKNTVALAWDDRIVISPHIGDLTSARSQQIFEQVIEDLQNSYQVKAQRVVCDAHPGYRSTRWAKQAALPSDEIFHHYAHAAVLAGEYPNVERWLVFTWDGVGYGVDGSLWGGEALYGQPGQWQRLASWRPFHLPGGDKAARQPWRSAAALCWEAGLKFETETEHITLVQQAWQQRLNTAKTSAVGRLFDAAAALTHVCQHASFEGQAPMWLEAQASRGSAESIPLPLTQNAQGLWLSDWQPLIAMLQDSSRSVPDRARAFHESMAHALLDQAMVIREQQGEFAVGLCGGVFQNKLLSERVEQLLTEKGFHVYLPQTIPLNDGGLCYGQVIEFAASH